MDLTPDEAIALLKKTALPTLIVEGNDDIVVYRTFERDLADLNLSVLPVGGRNTVLEIFTRKHELADTKVVFVADQDVWVTAGIPAEYAHKTLIFTAGYSIENDIFVDGNLRNLLKGAEVAAFETEVIRFLRWYALALSRYLLGKGAPIRLHPTHVLDSGQYGALTALQAGEPYPNDLFERLKIHYPLELRGKAVFGLLLRRINAPGRGTQHHSTGLMEMVAIRPGALLTRLLEAIRAGFN